MTSALTKEFALRILFVCTGNICRSPIAERLTIAHCARSDLHDVVVSSAGTHAVVGSPIEPVAARVLQQLGGDESNFAARQLTPRIAADADLVVTMTRAHRDDVLRLVPQQLHRTFTLRETARLILECNAETIEDLAVFRPRLSAHDEADIADPIGRDESIFESVGRQIAELVPPLTEICQQG